MSEEGKYGTWTGEGDIRATQALPDDAFEGETEVLGEQSIDDGIDGGIAVSQPEHHGEQEGMDTVWTEGACEVDCEEG